MGRPLRFSASPNAPDKFFLEFTVRVPDKSPFFQDRTGFRLQANRGDFAPPAMTDFLPAAHDPPSPPLPAGEDAE